MTETVRMFIGCAPNHEDAESQAVLEYSVRKHATVDVQFTWMRLSRDPASPFYSSGDGAGWRTERWATPFSGFRWAVPHLCDFNGRAIYSDSDVIYRADVAELWRQEIPEGKVVLAKGKDASWRYCVSLWDCERMRTLGAVPVFEALQRDPLAHSKLVSWFAHHPELTQPFAGDWNCLDGGDYASLDDPNIKAIHYTDMSTQPQLRHALPRLKALGRSHWYNGPLRPHWRKDLVALFDKLYAEAQAEGFNVARYTQEPPYGPINKADLTNYRGRAPR